MRFTGVLFKRAYIPAGEGHVLFSGHSCTSLSHSADLQRAFVTEAVKEWSDLSAIPGRCTEVRNQLLSKSRNR
jgi:hypothetical protein